MSDEKLIRLSDALAALTKVAVRVGITGEPQIMILAKEALRAIPAVQVGVKPCGGCGEINPRKRCIGCLHDFGTPENDALQPSPDVAALVEAAVKAERDRIIDALRDEADMTPCDEDAVVVRDCADLIEVDFSYEDAERLKEARLKGGAA